MTVDPRAELIHRALTKFAVAYPGPEDANKAHAALDALVAETVGPVSGAVVMRFWCGHVVHLANGNYPVSRCPYCRSEAT